MSTNKEKVKPKDLDEAIRLFKGYVNGENGFDELDFKSFITDFLNKEIDKAIERDRLIALLKRQTDTFILQAKHANNPYYKEK